MKISFGAGCYLLIKKTDFKCFRRKSEFFRI